MPLLKHTSDSGNVSDFAIRNAGWHSFNQDKRTKRAVERAALLGAVEVNGNQFRCHVDIAGLEHSKNPALRKAYENYRHDTLAKEQTK